MARGYSPRRVLRRQLAIFRRVGIPIKLWIRNNAPVLDSAAYQPGSIFVEDTDPVENTENYTTRFVFGKFEETDVIELDGPGRRRLVKGVIVIPMLYKALLAACEYIDPYLDGSRFIKKGSIIDESRLFCTLNIESLSLTSVSEVE